MEILSADFLMSSCRLVWIELWALMVIARTKELLIASLGLRYS